MHNFCEDMEKIIEAAKSGLISHQDLQKYIRLTYKANELKKSKAIGSITESNFNSTVPKFHFEKSIEGNQLTFKLRIDRGFQNGPGSDPFSQIA